MTKNYKKRSLSAGGTPVIKTEGSAASLDVQNKKIKPEPKAVQNGKTVNPKKELKSPEKKMESRKNRKVIRRQKGQYKVTNVTLTADKLKERIEQIEAKGNLTKTARRKLAVYRKKLAIETGVDVAVLRSASKVNKKELGQAKKGNIEPGSMLRIQKDQQGNKKSGNLPATKVKKEEEIEKKKIKPIKVEPEDDDEDDEDDDIDSEGEDDEDSEDEEEDDEEEDDSDSEPDDDDAVKDTANKGPQTEKSKPDGKKKRYVLFVGNIPFDITTDELKSHFLTKVSAVSSVRIPPKQGNKPRGIAYVELTNEIDFEKALSLHHSFLKGRRINVQYTAGGSNPAGHKAEIIAKNKKLHALRQTGKFGGTQQKGGAKFAPMGGRPFQKKTKT